MLEVESLDAYYGDSHVLHGAAISVGAAERVALLGRNGAGKSTLLKSVMNAGPRVRGRIAFDGVDLARLGVHRRTRLGVALVPEDRRLFGHLTVDENIAMARYGASPGRPAIAVDDIIARFPMLAPLRGRHGGQLSGGQQQLVAVARGLAANPRLLLLDEPTEGLAPIIVDQMADDLVRNCRDGRVGLLLCEQNIAFARRCTERVCVIDARRIVFSGDWPAFDRAPQIQQRHLAL